MILGSIFLLEKTVIVVSNKENEGERFTEIMEDALISYSKDKL